MLNPVEQVKAVYEQAREYIRMPRGTPEWLREGVSFRTACDRAQLNSRRVLDEVRAEHPKKRS